MTTMSMYSSALKAYKRADLSSAPKTEILDRLFARLESDLHAGKDAIASADVAARAQALDHATRILTELVAALDHRSAPELCANLEALYRFCLACLSKASFDRSGAPLDKALGILTTLRSAFAEAAALGKAP